MNKPKFRIEVREKATGKVTEEICRKLWAESIGNFNPIFCRYKKEHHLVNSGKGDLSDPFRADESYLDSLYIEV